MKIINLKEDGDDYFKNQLDAFMGFSKPKERYLSIDACNHWVNLDWDLEEATMLNLSIDPNEKVLQEDYLLYRNTKVEITCRLDRCFNGIEIYSILTEKKTPIEWIGIFSEFKPEIDKILGVSLFDENLLSAIKEIETNKIGQEINFYERTEAEANDYTVKPRIGRYKERDEFAIQIVKDRPELLEMRAGVIEVELKKASNLFTSGYDDWWRKNPVFKKSKAGRNPK